MLRHMGMHPEGYLCGQCTYTGSMNRQSPATKDWQARAGTVASFISVTKHYTGFYQCQSTVAGAGAVYGAVGESSMAVWLGFYECVTHTFTLWLLPFTLLQSQYMVHVCM